MANELGTRNQSLSGLTVLDEKGAVVGFVSDVIHDNGGDEPTWLVVDCGWMRASHYVPTKGSFVTSKGDVIVPFRKKWVKAAPKASEGNVLTSEIRRQLAIYYG